MEEIINKIAKDISILDIKETDYCIIMYKINFGSRMVQFVYKSLHDFLKKCKKDAESIDASIGIDVQIWIFD